MRHLVLDKNREFILQQCGHCALSFGQVRIATAFAGLSFTDKIIQSGWYRYQREHFTLPYTPGFEASGVISEVGPGVNGFSIGDCVVVIDKQGCFSEEIVANAETVILLPHGVDLRWAASLPVNFFTAFHALNNIVRIFPGSHILVESAAGGVGGILTQLAATEHHVYGLVGDEGKREYVLSLGAKQAFSLANMPPNLQFDVIFSASGEHLARFIPLLRRNGKLLMYGFHSLVPETKLKLVKTLFSALFLPKIRPFHLVYNNRTVGGFNIIQFDPAAQEYALTRQTFLAEVQKKTLTQHDITSFRIEEHRRAFELLSNRSHRGKIVLEF